MKEEKALANHGQTVYSERGKDNMAEPVATLERPSGRVSNGDSNGEARAALRVTNKAVSKEEQAKEEIGKAIKQFVKEEVDREEAPRLIEQEAQAATVPDGVKNYFPHIPAGMGGAVSDFYQELGKLTTKDAYIYYKYIPAEFFIRHYLRLRKQAEEKGQDISFLSEIKKELADRKINADSLYSQAKGSLTMERQRRRHWRGEVKAGRVSAQDAAFAIGRDVAMAGGGASGLDLSGITDPILRAKGEEINDQIAILGEQYNELRSRWGEVSGLNGTVPHDQKKLLLNQINEAMKRAREEQRKEEEKYRYTKPGVGISGERTLFPEDIAKIEADIDELTKKAVEKAKLPDGRELKGENIDYYFNRIFNRVDSLRSLEFDKAMGYGANREHEDFTRELSSMKNEASRKYQEATDPKERKHQEYKREIIQRFLDKYSEETDVRRLLHNAFFIADTEGEFKDFAGYCKSFASKYADQAFLDKPEVAVALRVREYILYEIKRENKGLIPPELVSYSPERGESVWEQRSKELLTIENNNGTFGRTLDDWEIDRAMSLSRGLGMVFLRFPEIIAEIATPTPTGTMQSKKSIVWEKLAWDLNPLDHRIKRYETQFGLRAILYAAKKRMQGQKLWNQDELHNFVALDAVATMVGRIIDFRNIFRNGGPFTWVPWRPFVAAIDEGVDIDGSAGDAIEKYRGFLGTDPGIAAKMFFNRYKYKNMTFDKLEFMRDAPKQQYSSDKAKLEAWQGKDGKGGKKKELEGKYKGEWGKANEEMWKGAANRVPHVILRLMLDEHNGLLSEKERLDLIEKISGNLGVSYFSTDFSKIERDLVAAKENMMKRRREKGKDFTEAENQLLEEDFKIIGKGEEPEQDPAKEQRRQEEINRRIEMAKELRKMVVDRLDKDDDLMKKLLERDGVDQDVNTNWSYCPTLEDTALDEYRYEQTGARGFFSRKITDAFSVSEAGDELLNLIKQMPNFRNAEDIVEQLKKIYYKVEGYNKEAAQDAIGTIAIGIIRFFEKDGILKVPIYGEMKQFLNAWRPGDKARGNSFAQTIYGGRAMAWDSDDIYNFTEMLKTMLVDKDLGAKLIKNIRNETGGTALKGFFRKSKLAIYLLILFGFYEFASKLMTEKQ